MDDEIIGGLLVLVAVLTLVLGVMIPRIGHEQMPARAYIESGGAGIVVNLDRVGWDLRMGNFKLSEYEKAKALCDSLNALLSEPEEE